jgi:hypothetical protein
LQLLNGFSVLKIVSESLIEIKDSNFTRNEASIEGGVIKYTNIKPLFMKCLFTDNSAPYGPIWASYPVRLLGYIVKDNKTTFHLSVDNVVAGEVFKSRLVFELKDEYNQTVTVRQTEDE